MQLQYGLLLSWVVRLGRGTVSTVRGEVGGRGCAFSSIRKRDVRQIGEGRLEMKRTRRDGGVLYK